MRAFLLISSLVLGSAFRVSGDEACHFVGARFARTLSSCVDGVCTLIHRDETGAFVGGTLNGTNVRCVDAVETVQVFLGGTAEPVRRSKRVQRDGGDAPELIRLLRTEVLPHVKRLAFGAIVSPNIMNGALRRFEERTRVLAARSFRDWHDLTVPAMVASEDLAEVSNGIGHIVKSLLNRPLTLSSLRASQRTIVHFYFDIAAVMGGHFIRPGHVKIGSLLLRQSIPRFRPVDIREKYRPLAWQGVPSDVPTVMHVAGAIERLASPQMDILSDDITTLYLLLSGWELSPPSAARALIHDQIMTSLCPELDGLVGEPPSGSPFTQTVLWVITSLLDFCRPFIPIADRLKVWDSISQRVTAGNGRFPDAAQMSAAEFLLDEAFSGYVGFSESISFQNRQDISGRLLREFVSDRVTWSSRVHHQVPRFLNDPERDAVGFGRALGLAIADQLSVRTLNIDRTIVQLLHPRFRYLETDLQVIAYMIAPVTIDEVLGISSGLVDTLGRGGLEIYSASAWLALFGHSL